MKKTSAVSVAILGINGADSPSAGLILSQCLRRQRSLPVRIIALAENPFTDGIQAVNHADEVVVVPSPRAAPEAFVLRVGELARRVPQLVLLPGGPSEWLALIPLRRRLSASGASLLFPAESLADATLPLPDREKLGRQFLIPRHHVARSRDLRPILKITWHFPLRLRASDGTTAIARTAEELEYLIAQQHAVPLLIQEMAPGEEISIAALGDRRGRPIGWVAAEVLSRSDNGAVWSAVTVGDSRIRALVDQLLAKLAWPGPLTLTLSFGPRGPYFTGIEPGFPSWISLAPAAGQDLPLNYVRLALGTSVLPASSYRAGLFLARVAVDQPTDITALSRLVTQGEYSDGNDRPTELRAAADHAAGARHHR